MNIKINLLIITIILSTLFINISIIKTQEFKREDTRSEEEKYNELLTSLGYNKLDTLNKDQTKKILNVMLQQNLESMDSTGDMTKIAVDLMMKDIPDGILKNDIFNYINHDKLIIAAREAMSIKYGSDALDQFDRNVEAMEGDL